MPSIPHSFTSGLFAYAAPLAAFVVALAVPLMARGKGWANVAGPLALFAGWALLQPLSLLPRVIWAPHRGTETLLAPALACAAGTAVLAWRGGRQTRLAAVLMTAFAGWWVAREGVGPVDFWRAWFAVGVLAVVLSKIGQGRADRILVVAAALSGGLAVAGAGPGWPMAALVAAAGAGGLLASRAPVAIPAAMIAALVAATDLAGGRLLRARLDTTDLACLAAVVAPWIADLAAQRLGRLPRPVAAVLSCAIGVGGAVACVWILRRALFT